MLRRHVVTICTVATSGMLVWALHFAAIYFFNTLACTRAFWRTELGGTKIVPLVVGLATVVAIILTSAILLWVSRNRLDDDEQTQHFLHFATSAVGLISIIAVFWNAIPAFIVPACG